MLLATLATFPFVTDGLFFSRWRWELEDDREETTELSIKTSPSQYRSPLSPSKDAGDLQFRIVIFIKLYYSCFCIVWQVVTCYWEIPSESRDWGRGEEGLGFGGMNSLIEGLELHIGQKRGCPASSNFGGGFGWDEPIDENLGLVGLEGSRDIYSCFWAPWD